MGLMPCVFCKSDEPLTNEHVWPQWVRPLLESSLGGGTATRTTIRESGTESHTYPTEPASLTVKSVCAACNNGWMAHLEARAKPALMPLLLGKKRTLMPPARLTIATWSVKTALVSGSRFKPAIPASFYEDFYEHQTPAKKARVWLSSNPYTIGFHYIDLRPLKVHPRGEDPPEEHNGYQAVLAVGNLVMYVIGWSERKPNLPQVYEGFNDALAPIWLADHQVAWPPKRSLKQADLDDLADALGAIPPTPSTPSDAASPQP